MSCDLKEPTLSKKPFEEPLRGPQRMFFVFGPQCKQVFLRKQNKGSCPRDKSYKSKKINANVRHVIFLCVCMFFRTCTTHGRTTSKTCPCKQIFEKPHTRTTIQRKKQDRDMCDSPKSISESHKSFNLI